MTSAVPPPASWLDRLFELLDDPSQPWAPVREPIKAARAELADLRRRAERCEKALRELLLATENAYDYLKGRGALPSLLDKILRRMTEARAALAADGEEEKH